MPFGVALPGPDQAELALLPGTGEDWDLLVTSRSTWETRPEADVSISGLLDLYLPASLAGPATPFVVAHLGQSLDGRIATTEGQSHYVTGPENILHLHRMRALCDAIVVGASTVELDDPQLTTRQVDGPSPLRVVIDPDCRLAGDRRVFRDPASPTLLICRAGQTPAWRAASEHVDVHALPGEGGGLNPKAIVDALMGRGCSLIFVEGGGSTVTRFVEAGAVDCLQLTIAPVIIGEGRQGLSLPAPASLADALRPPCRRFPMGQDVLFECDLRDATTD